MGGLEARVRREQSRKAELKEHDANLSQELEMHREIIQAMQAELTQLNAAHEELQTEKGNLDAIIAKKEAELLKKQSDFEHAKKDCDFLRERLSQRSVDIFQYICPHRARSSQGVIGRSVSEERLRAAIEKQRGLEEECERLSAEVAALRILSGEQEEQIEIQRQKIEELTHA